MTVIATCKNYDLNGYNTFAADEAVHRGCSVGDLFCVGAAVGRMGEYRVIQVWVSTENEWVEGHTRLNEYSVTHI